MIVFYHEVLDKIKELRPLTKAICPFNMICVCVYVCVCMCVCVCVCVRARACENLHDADQYCCIHEKFINFETYTGRDS
jgi:hypothetical protein